MDIDGKFYCSRCMRALEEDGLCPHCGYDHRGAANTSPALEQGTLLKRRYQLGSVIGKGGFGITYAAWDETLQIPVAIKEYFPQDFVTRNTDYSDEVEVTEGSQKKYLIGLEHFIRESRVLAMLKDIPGVVKVQDYFEENNTAYIVMEYVRGMSLGEYGLSKPQTSEVLKKLKEPIGALIALHKQGVMHRDITPDNLMVQEDGSVKLIDFGSAAQMNRDQSLIVVTQKYAPIEQYNSSGKGMGAWTDIYGLCATLYEVLTGMEPQESVLRAHRDELIPLEKTKVKLKKYERRAIMDGLAVEPEKRPQSMEEFRARLYHLPLPEEIRRRKQFVRRAALAMGTFAAGMVLAVLNFATGLPLGGGLLYSLQGDGLHIVGATGTVEELILPPSRLGLPVVEIDAQAFAGNDILETVSVPGSVRSVGSMAFSDCDALQTVTLQEGVTILEEYAFAQCDSLRTVYLPESLGQVSVNAFDGTSLYLTVWGADGGNAQAQAAQMGLSFAVREEYEIQENENGGVTLASYSGDEARLVLPSYIDEKPVTELYLDESGVSTLIVKEVEELTLPEHISVIPHELFQGDSFGREEIQSALRAVTLNPAVKTIEFGAFTYSSLEEIHLPEGLEEIGSTAFSNSNLTSIDIPSSVTKIGSGAFAVTDLETVTVPDTVDVLESMAFKNCRKLKQVSLPETMEVLGKELFNGCSALEQITLPSHLKQIDSYVFANCSMLEYLEIPEGTEYIGEGVFQNCWNLYYVDIPASVTMIEPDAFSGCGRNLVIGGTEGSYAQIFAMEQGIRFDNQSEWSGDVAVVGEGAISFAAEAKGELILPTYDRENHTLIWSVASEECSSDVSAVQLPLYTEVIEADAFACVGSGLQSIEVPDSLKIIESNAFLCCEELEEFDFPEGLQVIETGAFWNCTSLKEAILPDSVNYLGINVFLGCESLENVHIPEGISYLGDKVFSGTGLKEVTIPSNVAGCSTAFSWCTALEEVVIREGVLQLSGTFMGCANLKDVYIYEDNIRIGETTFEGCPDVTLHGRAGSAAQWYAQEYGLKFCELDKETGVAG